MTLIEENWQKLVIFASHPTRQLIALLPLEDSGQILMISRGRVWLCVISI